MRTAVTSVGAVLDDIEHGLRVSSSAAGLITTLPVICFAGVGALTPKLAGRLSVHRLLVVALVLMTAGLALRATVDNLWLFVALSLVALVGGAVANITLPIIVKRDFPDRIGRMTAVYTTALAVGTTAGAGLTVPVGDLADGLALRSRVVGAAERTGGPAVADDAAARRRGAGAPARHPSR